MSARASVSPEQVWAVLRDGWSYSNWVVGTSHVPAVDSRCRIDMAETPTAGPGHWFDNPAVHFALTRRNTEALARVCALAERRTRRTT